MENIRTSSYMIPVKLENGDGKYMLIHGYTGAIDIVENVFLDKIKNISTIDSLREKTVHSLISRGYITTKTQEEEYAYVARIAEALHKKDKILNNTFTMVVSYNCNFRCPYCYEKRDAKDSLTHRTFTKDMVDKAFKAMQEIEIRKELRNKVIILYGGEPLLKENKEMISYIVKSGKKEGYKFFAVTNGYDLDHFEELLSPEDIYRLQITIDGTKEWHNQRRMHYKDENTFDKIVANVRLALNKDIMVCIRVNTDNNNINDFQLLQTLFEANGFTKNKNFSVHSSMLQNNDSISQTEQESLDFISVKSFFNKHKEMNSLSSCNDHSTYRKIYDAITNKKPIPFQSIFCASQASEYLLDPFGKIYPCWDMVGKKEYQIGDYTGDNIKWNHDILEKWKNHNITTSKTCKYCKYALLCGGGCMAQKIIDKDNNCSFFKYAFELAVNRAFDRFETNV